MFVKEISFHIHIHYHSTSNALSWKRIFGNQIKTVLLIKSCWVWISFFLERLTRTTIFLLDMCQPIAKTVNLSPLDAWCWEEEGTRMKMFLKLFPTQRVPIIRYSGAISGKGFEMLMYFRTPTHKRCQNKEWQIYSDHN